MSRNTSAMESLRRVQIFSSLPDPELLQVASVCKIWRVPAEHVIFREGDEGDELFIVQEGLVQVALNTNTGDGTFAQATINMLYPGQSFGELVLLDGAMRSATVTSMEPSVLLVLKEHDFARLCDSTPHIGYSVMRQLASDLAYKLRSSNLLLRGNIRWQQGELGRRSR